MNLTGILKDFRPWKILRSKSKIVLTTVLEGINSILYIKLINFNHSRLQDLIQHWRAYQNVLLNWLNPTLFVARQLLLRPQKHRPQRCCITFEVNTWEATIWLLRNKGRFASKLAFSIENHDQGYIFRRERLSSLLTKKFSFTKLAYLNWKEKNLFSLKPPRCCISNLVLSVVWILYPHYLIMSIKLF